MIIIIIKAYEEINKTNVILIDATFEVKVATKDNPEYYDALNIDKIYHDDNGNGYKIIGINYDDFEITVQPLDYYIKRSLIYTFNGEELSLLEAEIKGYDISKIFQEIKSKLN